MLSGDKHFILIWKKVSIKEKKVYGIATFFPRLDERCVKNCIDFKSEKDVKGQLPPSSFNHVEAISKLKFCLHLQKLGHFR